jgi:DNA-binding ferritin-like protein
VSANVHSKVARRLMGGVAPLSAVLSTLRAASFLHQTHHWQTRGPSYFADHLMFDRLYTESQGFIDQVGERAVGSGDASFVDVVSQARRMSALIEVITRSEDSGADQLVQTSLKMESLVIAVVDEAIDLLRDADSLTAGTDNLLQGVADLHETFVYLLQQRVSRSGPHDYAR